MPEPVTRFPSCTNCNEKYPPWELFRCQGENCTQRFCWACIDDIDNNGFPIDYDVPTGKMICPVCYVSWRRVEIR